MLETNEIHLLQCCLATYVELANTQKNALIVGMKGCNLLDEIYTTRVNQCYELQKKLSVFYDAVIAVKSSEFSSEDLKKIECVLNKIFTINKK